MKRLEIIVEETTGEYSNLDFEIESAEELQMKEGFLFFTETDGEMVFLATRTIREMNITNLIVEKMEE
jgi:hypothetical protein